MNPAVFDPRNTDCLRQLSAELEDLLQRAIDLRAAQQRRQIEGQVAAHRLKNTLLRGASEAIQPHKLEQPGSTPGPATKFRGPVLKSSSSGAPCKLLGTAVPEDSGEDTLTTRPADPFPYYMCAWCQRPYRSGTHQRIWPAEFIDLGLTDPTIVWSHGICPGCKQTHFPDVQSQP